MVFDDLGDEDALDRQVSRIDDWLGDIQQRAENARTLNRTLTDIRASATSADRLVSVTVDASGRLLELDLDDGVRRHAGSWLAGQMMRTVAQARQRAAQQVERAVADTVGTDSPQGQAIITAMTASMTASPAAPPRPRP
jgi:DNA-binding protein YbaB